MLMVLIVILLIAIPAAPLICLAVLTHTDRLDDLAAKVFKPPPR